MTLLEEIHEYVKKNEDRFYEESSFPAHQINMKFDILYKCIERLADKIDELEGKKKGEKRILHAFSSDFSIFIYFVNQFHCFSIINVSYSYP